MNSNPTVSAILLCPQSEQVHTQTEKMVKHFKQVAPQVPTNKCNPPQPLCPYQGRFFQRFFCTYVLTAHFLLHVFHIFHSLGKTTFIIFFKCCYQPRVFFIVLGFSTVTDMLYYYYYRKLATCYNFHTMLFLRSALTI